MHKICGQSLCIITHCAKCRISGCRPAKILCIFSLDKCCRLCYTETTRARTASAPMCHGTRISLPWYPIPTTYIHTCIDTFVLFIYLFILLSLFILLFLSLLLFSSLLFSLLSLSPCPWQGLPLGRGSRSYLSYVYQCFILFNYYPVVHMYGMVCMYPHVLYSVCVYIIYYVCIQQMYVCT